MRHCVSTSLPRQCDVSTGNVTRLPTSSDRVRSTFPTGLIPNVALPGELPRTTQCYHSARACCQPSVRCHVSTRAQLADSRPTYSTHLHAERACSSGQVHTTDLVGPCPLAHACQLLSCPRKRAVPTGTALHSAINLVTSSRTSDTHYTVAGCTSGAVIQQPSGAECGSSVAQVALFLRAYAYVRADACMYDQWTGVPPLLGT